MEINKFIEMINNSVSPFHAVSVISEELEKNQFMGLNEAENFNIKESSNYYCVRNDGSIIAFKMPNNEVKEFKIVASHTDSPTFKIKPGYKLELSKYSLLNTEIYGGPILSTWLDRPLGVAGRLFYSKGKEVEELLVDLPDCCTIPNTAIHMLPELNNGYKYDPQYDLVPLIGSSNKDLLDYLSEDLEIKKDDILSYDLFLYNTDEGKVIGIEDEYISSPRIDNLGCAFSTLDGFINSKTLDNTCLVYAAFNYEEVGSHSLNGADSSFLIDVLNRIMNQFSNDENEAVLQRSFIISADNAHAVHYATQGKMDPTNRTYMNEGIVIKNACSQTYTTDALSKAYFVNSLRNHKISYQEFTNKSGTRGGSTLGSISQCHVSIPSIDIGLPQLAMHSSRELCGVKDIDDMAKAIKNFFEE